MVDLLDALDAGRSAAIGGKGGGRWARDRRRFSIDGTSWHREELHGLNGWHAHLHGLIFTSRELSADELDELEARIFGRYEEALRRKGRRALRAFNRIEPVREPEAVGAYVTKQDRAAGRIAAEMTRGDLKHGEGITPGVVLHRFVLTGDVADLDRFREYERASEGRRWRYLSPALVRRYGVAGDSEADDERDAAQAEAEDRADAADTIGGEAAVTIPVPAWRIITRERGAVSHLRRLIHAGDLDAARFFVASAEAAARRAASRAPDRPNAGSAFAASRAGPPPWTPGQTSTPTTI